MKNSILIPVDGSEASLDAARLAINLAGGLGLGLVALRVIDVDRYASEFEAVRETVTKELEAHAKKILEEVSRLAADGGASIEAHMRHGDSSREIIRFAQENQEIVLIVMGAAGRRRLARQMIGSTAERVVRQVGRDLPCPVTIVPSIAAQPEARIKIRFSPPSASQ